MTKNNINNINVFSKSGTKGNLKHKFAGLILTSACALSLGSNQALASGFDLPVYSTSSMALANQSAALAEDASVIALNPAGIANLNGYTTNVNVLNAFMDITFKNAESYYGRSNYRDPSQPAPEAKMVRGLTSGRMAPLYQPIPSIFSSFQLADFAYFGLGIYAPYGNTIAVKPNTVLRYTLENSAMMAIDVIPTFSFKIAEDHLLGLGIIGQYFHMELSQFADISPAIMITALTQVNDAYKAAEDDMARNLIKNQVAPEVTKNVNRYFQNGTMDTHVHMDGSHIGFGVNLGYIWKINDDINLGFAYRSPIKHKLKMDVKWEFPKESETPFAGKDYLQLAEQNASAIGQTPKAADIKVYYKDVIDGLLESGFVPKEKGSMELTTPQTASIHFSWRVIPELTLMSDFTYTNYSVMKQQVMKFEHAKHIFNPQPLEFVQFGGDAKKREAYLKSLNTDASDAILGMNWRDTFKAGIAFIYEPFEDLQVKTGFQFDSSPIKENQYRATMAPDNHRFIFGLGAKYKFLKHHAVDFAYTLLYVMPARSEWKDWCGKTTEFGEGSLACTSSYSTTKVDFNTMAHFIGLGYSFHYDTSKNQ